MSMRLSIANPQRVVANVRLTFTNTQGEATRLSLEVPARARRTVDLSTIPALAGSSFSTLLESDQMVGLDRLVSWDRRGLAASLESAVDQPATTWYFAEGSTIDPFELFYLVQNPGSTAGGRAGPLPAAGRPRAVTAHLHGCRGQPRHHLGRSRRLGARHH